MNDYFLGGRTAVRLRDDLITRASHCAMCATPLGRMPAVVVVLDGAGVLCRTCMQHSPLACLADAMRMMFVHGDDEQMILGTWRAIARDYFRVHRGSYPAETQAAFDRVVAREARANRQELEELLSPVQAAGEQHI
jgi:hypothetical protein